MKRFVLDTSVLIHDPSCLEKFADNKLIVSNVVLEELDRLKTRQGDAGYNAREATRRLDEMGFGHQDCTVEFAHCTNTSAAADDRIIGVAKKSDAIVVTRDGNMRCRARAAGVPCEDYLHTQTPKKLWQGYRCVDVADPWLIDRIYSERRILADDLVDDAIENEYFSITCGSQSVLAVCRSGQLHQIAPSSAYGITAKNVEQRFALHALLDQQIPLVSMVGKAGAGKTICALAAAIEQRQSYRQILLTRPLVPMGGQDMLGFVPGSLQEKLAPHVAAYMDNLAVLKSSGDRAQEIGEFLNLEKIKIEALQHMRGRSLHKVMLIVDEAANCTPHEMKTIVSRMGQDSKLVVMGDVEQIDSPMLSKDNNGLSYLVNKMRGQKLYAHITMTKSERSPLAELAGELL